MEAGLKIAVPRAPPSVGAGASAKDHLRRGRSAPVITVPAMSAPVVSAEDFDERAAHLDRVGAKAISVARAVLVDGRGPTEVAKEYDVTKQYVDKCAKRVRLLLENLPDGWERVEEWFPPDLARTVRAMAEAAREELLSRKR